MLKLENLSVKVGDREILHDINLEIRPGEVHVLFGPNGSGKTSLLGTIMGFERYRVVRGRIYFQGQDVTDWPVDARARLGIGLSFQRPPTVRGVTTRQLVEVCGQGRAKVEALAAEVNFQDFLDREVNLGFSGGELKRSELLQLLAQDPQLVLLDEPESGVDLENMALIGRVVNRLLERDVSHREGKSQREIRRGRRKSGLIITHTGHILNYVNGDVGHVLFEGRLSCVGNPRELLSCIQELGYEECIRCSVGNATSAGGQQNHEHESATGNTGPSAGGSR
ncbi:MAG: ABC transporter ATP-binding protein [Moorellales bacterium]